MNTIFSDGNKRVLSFVLCVAMILQLFTTFAFAADDFDELFEFEGEGTYESPYILKGEEGLRQLAFNMNL